MANDRFKFDLDGQELEQSDVELVSTEAAHADDYVLAELLRLPPYDGVTTARAIVPHAVSGQSGAMVRSNGATGSVKVMPFRAVIGSRVGPGATSTDKVDRTGAMLNWRGILSAVYSITDDGTTLGHAIALAANGSGNPRWDLVYAQLVIEQDSSTVTRFVEPPLATSGTPQSVKTAKVQSVTVTSVAGVAGASPSPPATPSDVPGSGVYNFPLAYVLVPAGFNGASTVLARQIHIIAPISPISQAFGAIVSRPVSCSSTKLSTAQYQAWASGNARPTVVLSGAIAGGLRAQFAIDATSASGFLADQGVVDDTIDWRKRKFKVDGVTINGATDFAWDAAAVGGATVPGAGVNVSSVQYGQSYVDDSVAKMGVSRNAGTVWFGDHTTFAPIPAGNKLGLYVDLSTGALRLLYTGTPGVLVDFWIDATGSYDLA